MQVTADKLGKGQLRMKSLASEIRQFWDACAAVAASPVPGGALEIGNLDPIINALDHALTTIRTLDLEVLDASDTSAYSALCKTDPYGLAVRAVTGPRNYAVHGTDVVDPDIANALGPLPGTGLYAVLPKWKPRAAVPASVFQFRGVDKPSYQRLYDDGAAGRPILDTLLDAFRFFDNCDPRVAERHSDGQLVGFPLVPLPLVNRYRRLHPDSMSEHDWNLSERQRITALPPGGVGREISARISSAQGILLCGLTKMDDLHSEYFVEPVEQVVRDVELGYTYRLDQNNGSAELSAAGGRLSTDGVPIDLNSVAEADDLPPWEGWWELCLDDANYYRIRRQQPLVDGGLVFGPLA